MPSNLLPATAYLKTMVKKK